MAGDGERHALIARQTPLIPCMIIKSADMDEEGGVGPMDEDEDDRQEPGMEVVLHEVRTT